MESNFSLQCSQQSATCPCSEPDEFTSYPQTIFLLSGFPIKILYTFLIFLMVISEAYLS